MVKIDDNIDIIEKISRDVSKRHQKATENQEKLIKNFTSVLPVNIKNVIRQNPNINLLYVADKLDLRELYNDSLKSIGFTTNDAIRFLLQFYMNDDDFSKEFQYSWVTKSYFDVNKKDSSTIMIESTLGDINVFKTNLVSTRARYVLLKPYKYIIDTKEELNDCHLLSYAGSKMLGIDATTGNINDMNGSMNHSWCEDGMSSIDIANGYVMNSVDFYNIHIQIL